VKPYPKDKDKKKVKVLRVKMVGPKARSVKKQKEMLHRHKLSIELRRERGDACEAGLVMCTGMWHDMHELLARSQGGDPLDKANVLCVCRPCHSYLTDHHRESIKLGLKHTRQVQCA